VQTLASDRRVLPNWRIERLLPETDAVPSELQSLRRRERLLPQAMAVPFLPADGG